MNKTIIFKNIKEKIRLEEKHFFTGRILYQNRKLNFMFDPEEKMLIIFEWQWVSREDNKKIYNFLIDNLHPGTEKSKLKEMVMVA